MPLEIDRWLLSGAIRDRMKDYQRAWFLGLLITGWRNVKMPCHLPNDDASLWRAAGAHRKDYFLAHCGPVMEEFRTCGEGQWVCNANSLSLYLEKWTNYHRGSKDIEPLYYVLSSCTCLSKEERKKLGTITPEKQLDLANDWLPQKEWEAFLEMRQKIRKPPTERAIELLQKKLVMMKYGGYDIAQVLDQSTLNGWQDLYPLRGDKNARPSSIPCGADHVRCYVCKKDMGPKQKGDTNYMVCSDECAAKSGYEIQQ